MDASFLIIASLLFAVAFLYSSVGHGGASGYLAVLSLAGVGIGLLKPSALVLNIFVSIIAFYQFYKAGYFKWNLFYPFAIFSIPFAYIGGGLVIDPFWYKKILAVCLVLAVFRMVFPSFTKDTGAAVKPGIFASGITGSVIGFISGMIGIGGGIILSPVILLMKWGNTKEAAAVSSLFIFVNSVSGLAGISHVELSLSTETALWILVAIGGGIAGAYWGSRKAGLVTLKNTLAVILLIAAVKLLFV